jgi:hypothetical protein
MTRAEEIKSFLTSRRARLRPEDAGVPVFAGHRRVPGLRREEVAHLAGVSTDYYGRLERGNTGGASREVLDAIAGALQLDDTERQHLFDLVTITAKDTRRRPAARTSVAAGTQAVLDALTVPAIVQNGRLDIIAANQLGRALYDLPALGPGTAPFNSARFQFLNPNAADFYVDYDKARRNSVALLHQEVGRNPHDTELMHLIGELSAHSEGFRALWASHDVIRYQRGTKRYRHPQVGDIEFGYESFELTTDPGVTMLVYTVEPNSRTAEAMQLLASWASAPAPADSQP